MANTGRWSYMAELKKVIIHTDGSCLGNPGPGGWAAILSLANTPHRREMAGGFRRTTNNRMELMGAIMALEALKEPCQVELYTDSRYLRDAVEKGWLAAWRAKNFTRKNNRPVPNTDLWRKLASLLEKHKITMIWLRGHMGHVENERCDGLARAFAQKANLPPDEPYEASKPDYPKASGGAIFG